MAWGRKIREETWIIAGKSASDKRASRRDNMAKYKITFTDEFECLNEEHSYETLWVLMDFKPTSERAEGIIWQ